VSESPSNPVAAVTRANDLVRLFSRPGPDFATFREVSAAEVPEPARGLLDHASHMTVAMERLHGTPLGLRVVARARDSGGENPWYAREILLLAPSDAVVQYGIVRIDLSHVDAATAAAVRGARLPLGRVLIDAGLLREVHAVALLEVAPGPRLAALFGPQSSPPAVPERTYGRVAEISLGGHPAVELLEILPPHRG
jgi:chorismate-pyruvate lyase